MCNTDAIMAAEEPIVATETEAPVEAPKADKPRGEVVVDESALIYGKGGRPLQPQRPNTDERDLAIGKLNDEIAKHSARIKTIKEQVEAAKTGKGPATGPGAELREKHQQLRNAVGDLIVSRARHAHSLRRGRRWRRAHPCDNRLGRRGMPADARPRAPAQGPAPRRAAQGPGQPPRPPTPAPSGHQALRPGAAAARPGMPSAADAVVPPPPLPPSPAPRSARSSACRWRTTT
jgi:hypothetical protein